MSTCTGDGRCYTYCVCICDFDDIEVATSNDCTCGHFNCDLDIFFHKDESCIYKCEYIKCSNSGFCNELLPAWVFDDFPKNYGNGDLINHNKICQNCWDMYGSLKKIDDIKTCVVCLENKNVFELGCKSGHYSCLMCIKKNYSKYNRLGKKNRCPVCFVILGKNKHFDD